MSYIHTTNDFDLIPKINENNSLTLSPPNPEQSAHYHELIAPYQNDLALLPKVLNLAEALVLMTPNQALQKRLLSTHISFELTIVDGHKNLDVREENSRELAIRTEEIKRETASRLIEFEQDQKKNKTEALKSEFAIVSSQLATCELIESQSKEYKNSKANTEEKIKILASENEALLKTRDRLAAVNKSLRGQ